MYISGGDDQLNCKLFPGTLQGMAMHWLATLPPRSIKTFANKTKHLEVADLFCIKQTKGETLKSYLARFNNATVRVNNPDQKFFVKAFQKGLREGYLGQYVRRGSEKAPTSPRVTRRAKRGEAQRENHRKSERDEKRKERSRSPQRINTRHRGVITTILGGGVVYGWREAAKGRQMTSFERDMRYDPPRHDKPLVILVVVAEYKVQRVRIDQGTEHPTE
ncbi:hypothetical protein CR513_07151, partial [Mucuna pruriens]